MDKQNPLHSASDKQINKDQRKQSSEKNAEIIDRIQDNDYGILYQSEKYMKMASIRAGDRFQTSSGSYSHSSMVNTQWGARVQAHNKANQYISVLKPKSTLITETLARKTQILYSMDNSMILMKLNIVPGNIIVEAGTGSGSLSCAISEAIGDTGTLFTFQFNKERAETTKEFFTNLKKNNIVANWRDVVQNGFRIEGDGRLADSLFLDVPNPWAAISHAKAALKIHGRICCFSPCIQQVQRTCDELRLKKFKKIETVECLSREFDIENNYQITLEGIQGKKRMRSSSRAVHNNRGHTGYLTFAVSC